MMTYMTEYHLYSVYLEFWIRDNVSERTHSLPHDDWRLDKVRIPQHKDMSRVTDTQRKSTSGYL